MAPIPAASKARGRAGRRPCAFDAACARGISTKLAAVNEHGLAGEQPEHAAPRPGVGEQAAEQRAGEGRDAPDAGAEREDPRQEAARERACAKRDVDQAADPAPPRSPEAPGRRGTGRCPARRRSVAQPIAKPAPASIIAARSPIRSASQPAEAPATTSPVMKPDAAQPNQAIAGKRRADARHDRRGDQRIGGDHPAAEQEQGEHGRAPFAEEIAPAVATAGAGVDAASACMNFPGCGCARAAAYATSTMVEVKR